MRLSHLTITASDLDEALDFYHRVLELGVTQHANSFEVAIGRTTLRVERAETAWASIHLAITIPRNRFVEAKAWLSERTPLAVVDGVDEFALADEPWRSKSLYFRGPDGIVLELITRDALNNDSTEPFSSASLLCVSEAGVASQDVPATVARLRSKYHTKPFGNGSNEFAPIGDNEGLFIVVADGRPWFSAADSRARGAPTDIRAERQVGGPGTVRVMLG
jgi:catechol 2,3-dioxygenase-like lactoylglutathione lyase family enzyme